MPSFRIDSIRMGEHGVKFSRAVFALAYFQARPGMDHYIFDGVGEGTRKNHPKNIVQKQDMHIWSKHIEQMEHNIWSKWARNADTN